MSWRVRHERMTASVLGGLCSNPEIVPGLVAVRKADPGVLEALADYASLLADAALLRGSSVQSRPGPDPTLDVTDEDIRAGWDASVRAYQRGLIRRALGVAGGGKADAAALLRMNVRTFYNKMHELGIMVYDDRPKGRRSPGGADEPTQSRG